MCDPRLALAYSEKLFADKFRDAFSKKKKQKFVERAAKKPLARKLDYTNQNRKSTVIASMNDLSGQDPQVVTRLIGA